jgi:hypothetical protein
MSQRITRVALVSVVGALMIATAALAQLSSDSPVVEKEKAAIAHLTFKPKSLGFGTVKSITTKSMNVKNTGTLDANVNVVPPPQPFTIIAGAGSTILAPGETLVVSVRFAPTAAGKIKEQMAIQCANCNTTADSNVLVELSGDAKVAVVTPTPIPAPSAASTTPAAPTPSSTPSPSTANALPFEITAAPFEADDAPYASITICAHGTSNCTTVNNVLIDTGSFGLRIFGSQLSGLGIAPNTDGGDEVGECAFFGSGSTWGAISTVDVKIAGEPTITIPIQVIDDTNAFAPAPKDCTQGTQLMSSPKEFDGMLGIGQASNDLIFTDYFDCAGEDCSALGSVPSSDVVPNPVSAMPADNNGVVVSLPSISAGGQKTAAGIVYFGIGTESDNQPGSNVQAYLLDSNSSDENYLTLNTVFGGTAGPGFFDTGSNGYFFNDSSITECDDWYCPKSTLAESATNESVGTAASNVVNFQIANADTLFDTDDAALDDLGGTLDGGSSYDGFDWGLPFFFGRTVYLGIAGASSPLGAGPYTAY